MKEKGYVDIRTLPLDHIAGLRVEKWDSFRRVITSSLSGHESQELKSRLLNGATPNFYSKIQAQLELIDSILESCKTAVMADKYCEQRLSDAQTMYNFALEKFEEAKKSLALAEKKLNDTKKEYEKSQNILEQIGQRLESSRKDLDRKQRLIIIHPSTNLGQIIKYKDGIFLATKSDEYVLRKIGCVDKVFDEEVSFIDIIPEIIRKKYNKEELDSIISYANMVIHIALSKDSKSAYKLLYSNKDIDTILKVNGFEL